MHIDHVGYEALAVEQAVSTSINCFYPTFLLTLFFMEDLCIPEIQENKTPAHLTRHTVIFLGAQEESVIVSHINVDNCMLISELPEV